MSWLCDVYVLIELISFASVLQQTRRPVGAAESKCQMRSCLCLGAATLRFFLLIRFIPALLFCTFTCSLIKPSLCILISQYAPLSLRPLTCEVKAGHRWGPREQGCIQFQRPMQKEHFVKDDYMINICIPRKSSVLMFPFGGDDKMSRFLLALMYLSIQLYVSWVCWLFQCVFTCHDQDKKKTPSATDTLRGPTLLAGFVL